MVTKSKIPDNSLFKANENLFDYMDSYQSTFLDQADKADIIKIIKLFFTCAPKWSNALLAMRHKIVKLVGLKTDNETERQKQLENFKCEKGDRVGLFKVFDKTENEVIMGEDDKHLNFRVSFLLDKIDGSTLTKKITITTVVQFNNFFGRLYFLVICPFHKVIASTTLKGILDEIENEKTTNR